jgi:hypothetical protein
MEGATMDGNGWFDFLRLMRPPRLTSPLVYRGAHHHVTTSVVIVGDPPVLANYQHLKIIIYIYVM